MLIYSDDTTLILSVRQQSVAASQDGPQAARCSVPLAPASSSPGLHSHCPPRRRAPPPDHPGNLGGSDTWEDSGPWWHSGSIRTRLRERAVKMVLEVREREGKGHGESARIARQLDVHPEALRSWMQQAEIDRGQRLRLDVTHRSQLEACGGEQAPASRSAAPGPSWYSRARSARSSAAVGGRSNTRSLKPTCPPGRSIRRSSANSRGLSAARTQISPAASRRGRRRHGSGRVRGTGSWPGSP